LTCVFGHQPCKRRQTRDAVGCVSSEHDSAEILVHHRLLLRAGGFPVVPRGHEVRTTLGHGEAHRPLAVTWLTYDPRGARLRGRLVGRARSVPPLRLRRRRRAPYRVPGAAGRLRLAARRPGPVVRGRRLCCSRRAVDAEGRGARSGLGQLEPSGSFLKFRVCVA
jgi:hypothetical protein